MGCGCGGKGSIQPYNIKPTKILSLTELRDKVLGRKLAPSQGPMAPVRKPIILGSVPVPPADAQLFRKFEKHFDPLDLKVEKKTIILINRAGSAEGKYLRNLLTKFGLMILDYKKVFDFIESECSYLVNTKDFTIFPATVFLTPKGLFKKQFGLFDVRIALDEFYRTP